MENRGMGGSVRVLFGVGAGVIPVTRLPDGLNLRCWTNLQHCGDPGVTGVATAGNLRQGSNAAVATPKGQETGRALVRFWWQQKAS